MFILDQIFDEVYHDEPTPLNNLSFAVERKEGDSYVGYRDHSFRDYLITDFRSAEELLDSIKIARPTAFLPLNKQDTLKLDYALTFGRHYNKGSYRIRAVFVAKLTDKRWFIQSDWQYFEVKQTLPRLTLRETMDTTPNIFWQLFSNNHPVRNQ